MSFIFCVLVFAGAPIWHNVRISLVFNSNCTSQTRLSELLTVCPLAGLSLSCNFTRINVTAQIVGEFVHFTSSFCDRQDIGMCTASNNFGSNPSGPITATKRKYYNDC